MSEAGGIIGLYQRHGLAWAGERERGGVETVWFDRFRALLPQTGATVLDLGCGSGYPVARYFVEHGAGVVGVDTAAPLLARCRERLPGEWLLADMRMLSLGRRFQGVLAWNSFFHLDHDAQRRMFAVFRAHAAPGAALMFTSGPAHGEGVGCFGGEAMYHASLDPAEYRALLAGHGFVERGHVAEDPDCYGLTVWLAQAG